jgi:hypothetical protein
VRLFENAEPHGFRTQTEEGAESSFSLNDPVAARFRVAVGDARDLLAVGGESPGTPA